jgi:hypothetical protein
MPYPDAIELPNATYRSPARKLVPTAAVESLPEALGAELVPVADAWGDPSDPLPPEQPANPATTHAAAMHTVRRNIASILLAPQRDDVTRRSVSRGSLSETIWVMRA